MHTAVRPPKTGKNAQPLRSCFPSSPRSPPTRPRELHASSAQAHAVETETPRAAPQKKWSGLKDDENLCDVTWRDLPYMDAAFEPSVG
eukprot:2309450-Prymnesium_polylepis.1